MPDHWEIKKIPDVLFFQEGPGVRKWQFHDSGVKLLNVGNINNGKIKLSSTKIHLSEEEAFGKYSHFLVDDGDLLIACSGIVVSNFHNKIAFAQEKHLPLCLNTSTMRFKALDDSMIDMNYYRYYLHTRYFTGQLRKLITGSAQLNFGPSHIKKIDIPLPPLAEQQKIAAILDAADTLRQKDQQLIDHYTTLSQSLFLEMFGDPVINPMGWEKRMVQEVCTDIVDCVNKTAAVVDFSTDYKMIRTTNVRNYKVDLTKVRYVEQDTYEKWVRRLTPKRGDVIFTREAPVGEAGVLESDDTVFLGQRVMQYRTDGKKMNSYYLLYELMGNNIERQIQKMSAGSTVKHLSVPDCEKFFLNVPPIILQNQFAEHLVAIEQQKQQAEASLEKSEALFNSLLQRAFKGELTSRHAA